MMISGVSFRPPVEEVDIACVDVTFDGIMTVTACIFRMRNPQMKQSVLMVKWDDSIFWRDYYMEKCFSNEVLDRYYEYTKDLNEEKDMI